MGEEEGAAGNRVGFLDGIEVLIEVPAQRAGRDVLYDRAVTANPGVFVAKGGKKICRRRKQSVSSPFRGAGGG